MSQSLDAPRGNRLTALVIALLACGALVVAVKAGQRDDAPKTEPVAAEVVDLSTLKFTSTKTRLPQAPRDPAPMAMPDGDVVHPRKVQALFAAPGGEAFAKVGPRQFGDTWLPVIARQEGWVQVLLPSRPRNATGWLPTKKLDQAHSRFQIRIHLGARTLELFDSGASSGTWTVAIGADDTPTPTGRTFLLGQLVDENQPFSPVILPLGTHSATLDTYGGGPGTVAIHGWSDPTVFGQAISHGCVRVPADALEMLSKVPLGTPVLIDES